MWISNAILVNQPKGYEELAIFDIGNQWRNIILFIPAALGKIVLPLFSSSNNEINKFNIILKINIILNFIISLFFAVIISLFSSLIITAYGNDFYNGQSVIIILALSSVLISVNNVIGQSIAGIGKMWIGLFFNFIWAIFLIGFQLLFQSYNMGAIGMSLAYFISYLVLTFIQYFYIKNNHK
jgi:O-antigen/teichoic acid export membrane protein